MKIVCPGLFVVSFLISCGTNPAETKTTDAIDTATTVAATESPAKIDLIFPVKFKDWVIGDPHNINTVLAWYRHWDEKNIDSLAECFADTVVLRIPAERTDIVIPHNKIAGVLRSNQKQYLTTSNEIISAISVHETERDLDWVMITAYAKWVEKNGKRDSLLYHDDWQLKDGKVNLLVSFEKLPIKRFLETSRQGFQFVDSVVSK